MLEVEFGSSLAGLVVLSEFDIFVIGSNPAWGKTYSISSDWVKNHFFGKTTTSTLALAKFIK